MLYDFSLYKYTVIERLYDLDLNPLSSMLMFERPGYPYRIYFKFDPDYKEIKEVYPLLLDGDVKYSLKVFKNEKQYNKPFNFRKYSYLSWDLKTFPNQVYMDTVSGLKRYTGDDMVCDMEYENLNLDALIKRKDVPQNIKDFADSKNAEYIFLYWHDKKLVRFNLGITMMHPYYVPLRRDVEQKLNTNFKLNMPETTEPVIVEPKPEVVNPVKQSVKTVLLNTIKNFLK